MANNKYQISDEGIIYGLNEDGTVSQIGRIVDGELLPIEDDSDYITRQAISTEAAESFIDMDTIFRLYGDIFSGKKVSEPTKKSDTHNQKGIDFSTYKEDQIRIETKINKLKTTSLNANIFDNILLHVIKGFVWGKTSRKDVSDTVYKDATYYYYLNENKSIYLYQNKNYKSFHSLIIENLAEMPDELRTVLFFDECYSFNQWLFLIERIGLRITINSREKHEYMSFFGKIATNFVDALGMLVFESELFSVTLNLNPVDNDSPCVVKSLKITYKPSPENSFWGKIF